VIAPRFLIDENLSIHLPRLAHDRGYEATHVNHRGLREWSDWSLLAVVEAEGWVLVTNNAVEFRGRFKRLQVHPGVVFIVPSVPRAGQLELFGAALDEVDRNSDLINTALDATFENDEVIVRRYRLP